MQIYIIYIWKHCSMFHLASELLRFYTKILKKAILGCDVQLFACQWFFGKPQKKHALGSFSTSTALISFTFYLEVIK